MSEARRACGALLRTLVEEPGVLGACLISREGLPVVAEWRHPADLDTLAAMGAALMGAAETSLLEFGDDRLETVLVVSRDMRLVILGVDDEVLLLAAMDRSIPIDQFDQQLLESRTRLNIVLQAS